ncbi:hypothetical protein H5410_046796 [Solanum commersonii]|uniref:Uncharacterized protein n=1 Tax=Solanum commersonii TaxID=4109 RepID=A0A9J5XFC6_SOLCO|nr:hypothetical protein H5410_046796 [Solanum commersonii]
MTRIYLLANYMMGDESKSVNVFGSQSGAMLEEEDAYASFDEDIIYFVNLGLGQWRDWERPWNDPDRARGDVGTTMEIQIHMFLPNFPMLAQNQASVSDLADSKIEQMLNRVLKRVESMNNGVMKLRSDVI